MSKQPEIKFADVVLNFTESKLYEHMKRVLPKIKDIGDRIDFVRNKFKVRLTETLPFPKSYPRRQKSDELAKFARANGNSFKVLKNSYFAVREFNESICCALPASQVMSLAYLNRAYVYAEWKLWNLALENIQKAREIGFPVVLTEKTFLFETQCREELDFIHQQKEEGIRLNRLLSQQCEAAENVEPPNAIDDEVPLTLSFPPHSRLPHIANCLDSSSTDLKKVITVSPLEPGQVVAIENPCFASVLDPALRFERCHHCHAESDLNLLPCDTCTLAMFCSESCRSAARLYHKYECVVIDYLYKYFDVVQLIAVRAVILAFEAFNCSLTDVTSFVNEYCHRDLNVFNNLRYPLHITPKQKEFHEFYNVAKNKITKLPAEVIVNVAVFSLMVYHQLKAFTLIGKKVDTKREQDQFYELIYRCGIIAMTASTKAEYFNGVLAGDHAGVFSFANFFSHSCIPNTGQVLIDNRQYTIILRRVMKGEQLTCSYQSKYYCFFFIILVLNNLPFIFF